MVKEVNSNNPGAVAYVMAAPFNMVGNVAKGAGYVVGGACNGVGRVVAATINATATVLSAPFYATSAIVTSLAKPVVYAAAAGVGVGIAYHVAMDPQKSLEVAKNAIPQVFEAVKTGAPKAFEVLKSGMPQVLEAANDCYKAGLKMAMDNLKPAGLVGNLFSKEPTLKEVAFAAFERVGEALGPVVQKAKLTFNLREFVRL